MKKKQLSGAEVREALDLFVEYGILIKVTKDGEDAWQNNPDFEKKSKKEQQKAFDMIQSSEKISQTVVNELFHCDWR